MLPKPDFSAMSPAPAMAKHSSAMMIGSNSGSSASRRIGGGAGSSGSERRGSGGSAGLGGGSSWRDGIGLVPLSASCPRTPVSLKKRARAEKEGGTGGGAWGAGAAWPPSRRELERRLLQGDYLVFHYTPATATPATTTAVQPAAPAAAGASWTAAAPAPGSTLTLGSLLGVSALLLSSAPDASGSGGSLFSPSPAPSPHPSPAMRAFSPLMAALAAASPHPPAAAAAPAPVPASPLTSHLPVHHSVPSMSLDDMPWAMETVPSATAAAATGTGSGVTETARASSPPMEGSSLKRALTTQQHAQQQQQQLIQASVLSAPSPQLQQHHAQVLQPLSPAASPSPSHASVPSPLHKAFAHHRRAGSSRSAASGFLGSGLGGSGGVSATSASANGSGSGSANESSRGSFSSASGISALSGLLSADAASAMASVAASPSPAVPASPFTFLHTRRRNNSGPPGLLPPHILSPSSSSTPAVSTGRGMPEPGAPVAAFNVFGNRMPQPPSAAAAAAPGHAHDSDVTLASFLPAPALLASGGGCGGPLPSTLPAPISLTTHFEWERVIGRGSYGEVWLVRRRLPQPSAAAEGGDSVVPVPRLGERVAIKKLLLPVTSMAERRAFLRRAELLKQIVDVYNGRAPSPPLHASPLDAVPPDSAAIASPLTSPKLRSLNSTLAAQVVPASPKSMPPMPAASTTLGTPAAAATTTATAATAPFRWPAHLLEHRSIWQEDAHFYTETEACPLGDLFHFFAFGALLDARQRAHAAAVDAESSASSVVYSSDDDEESDQDESMGVDEGQRRDGRRRDARHPVLQLGRAASVASLTGLHDEAGADIEAEPPPETKALEERDLWHLLEQISSILSVLHAQGVLHNDVKPANIYVRRREQQQQDHQEVSSTDPDSIDPASAACSSYPFEFKLGDLGSIVNLADWSCGSSDDGDGSYLAPECLIPALLALPPTPSSRSSSNRSSFSMQQHGGIGHAGATPGVNANGNGNGPSPLQGHVRRAPPAHITPKIDIFSLGSLLFTLVTGERFTSSALQSQLLDRDPVDDGGALAGVGAGGGGGGGESITPASHGGELHMRELMHSCPLNTRSPQQPHQHQAVSVGANLNLTPTGGVSAHRLASLTTSDTPSRGNTPGAHEFDSPSSSCSSIGGGGGGLHGGGEFRTPTPAGQYGSRPGSACGDRLPPSRETVRRAPSLPLSFSHDSLSGVRSASRTGFGGGTGASVSSPLTPHHGLAPRSLVSTPPTPQRAGLAHPSAPGSGVGAGAATSTPLAAVPAAPLVDNEVHFDSATNVLPISLALQCMIRRMLSVQPSVRPSSDELHQWARRGISNAAWTQVQTQTQPGSG